MRGFFFWICLILFLTPCQAETQASTRLEHPRLFLTPQERDLLKEKKLEGIRPVIWKNLIESADWCLTKEPRKEWIAPIAEDPNYENLYDRFYAMMMDMAITEHLAFAYSLSGEEKYGQAVREWTLACCQAWRPDSEGAPDGGKAYAVSRLLKGIATSYDLAHDRFTQEERSGIREMLSKTAHNYYANYFTTEPISGPGFHTHHAIVEFSSFGIVALTLLGEIPEASEWLDLVIRKFERDLLPMGLASDGAQTEGATFWASTMHYRIFFMDALRRVTGRDLFSEFKQFMNADLALASVAAIKEPGWNETHGTVVFEPPYGQLDYYSPILLFMAREYRRPIYQHLGMWDRSLGQIQKTRYITPTRREQLLFELGGYAYVWYDPTVPAEPIEEPMSFQFDSVGQAYARGSWEPGGVLVAIDRSGQVVVHAGGMPILAAISPFPSSEGHCQAEVIQDSTRSAKLGWRLESDRLIEASLERPNLLRIEWTQLKGMLKFRTHRLPILQDGTLSWESGVTMRVLSGSNPRIISETEFPDHTVGNGRLRLIDPDPRSYPEVQLSPSEAGRLEIEIQGTDLGSPAHFD